LAVNWGGVEILHKMCELAEDRLTTQELNNNLCLDRDCLGFIAWNGVENCGKGNLLQNKGVG
jgi:hypothetical protein